MGSTESMLEGKRVSKLWVGARDAVFFFIFQCKLYFAISLLFFKFLIVLTAQLVEYYFPEQGSNPGPGTGSTES